MDLALHHPELGYYARAAHRSGRAGDFFTSVDVGPLFGELLAAQIQEMAGLLAADGRRDEDRIDSPVPEARSFDLVEAGAGNGQLSADILRVLRARDPAVFEGTRLHLVELSADARLSQRAVLGDLADRLISSSDVLAAPFRGVLVANELFDAMPVHQVVQREEGLREVYVSQDLTTFEGPPSTPELVEHLARLGVELEIGWRVEVNLKAVEWLRDASRRLTRGFMILIDYGHEAHELYSASHSAGTLTSFSRHRAAGVESSTATPWLQNPGEQDITAHVDFTSLRRVAEAEGLATLGFLDQTYFLLGLFNPETFESPDRRLALKSLIMPGGLGSTMKVLLLGKNVGTPSLRGCSFGGRVT